jgi:hypothetical protein
MPMRGLAAMGGESSVTSHPASLPGVAANVSAASPITRIFPI